MKYTKEQLMPKRYPENTPEMCAEYWFIAPGKRMERRLAHNGSFIWGGTAWYIDIPGAPDEVKPLKHPENKPNTDGEYWCHDSRFDKWTDYYFGSGSFLGVDRDVDYYIPINLDRLDESEEEVRHTDIVSMQARTEGGDIIDFENINDKNLIEDLARYLGYEVSVTKREPEIAPCPNCGMDASHIKVHSRKLSESVWVYQLICDNCEYSTPYFYSSDEAEENHSQVCGKDK